MQKDPVNKINSQQTTSTTTNDCISELLSDPHNILAVIISSSSSIAFTTTTTTSASILATTTIVSNEPWDQDHHDLAGGYPVEALERQWDVKWREDHKERELFNKLRSIITTINYFAQQHNITIETAANVAEE